jgi:translation elongation factor P/translation initiation factor 5A
MSAFSYRTSDVFQDRRGLARYVGWSTTGSDISTSTIHIIGVKPVLYLFFNNLVGYSGDNYNYGYVEDTWLSLNDNTLDALNNVVTRDLLFPLDGFSGGLISLEIYDYMVIPGLTSDDKNALKASIKEVRIKDVKFTVVDKDGKDLNISDTEYFSALDPNYLNDTKIELIHGTNVKGCPIEKASLLYDDGTAYQFCTSWTRNGQTNILEKLLQNTVKSNYLNPTLELSCNVNNLSSLIGCVQYASQLGTNIFMVNSATIHLRDNITDLIIQTVSKDILNIV